MVVARAERCAVREAIRALEAHRAPVERCFSDAYTMDPLSVSRLRLVEVKIRLERDGRALFVELYPPLIARGLSACLANTLLTWTQSGPIAARASVFLRISLSPR